MPGWKAALYCFLGLAAFIIASIIYALISRRIWMKKERIDLNDLEGGDKWLDEQRWKRQEAEDKKIIEENPFVKLQIETGFASLQAEHSMIKSGKFDHDKFHAELCLIGLTHELFVKKYDLFKTMDRRKIKMQFIRKDLLDCLIDVELIQ